MDFSVAWFNDNSEFVIFIAAMLALLIGIILAFRRKQRHIMNTKNYGFSDQERNEIINCVKKIRHGLTCVGSVKPLITSAL